MALDDDAEGICRRMAELRRELSCDVQEVGRTARVMTDWTFYVRRFPWAVAALAVAAGYMLVPRKKQVISPDPALLAEMVKKKQLRVEATERSKNNQNMLKSLAMMGITWAAKTGMNYMGERMRTAAVHKAHEPPRSAPATSPGFEPGKRQTGDEHARQPR